MECLPVGKAQVLISKVNGAECDQQSSGQQWNAMYNLPLTLMTLLNLMVISTGRFIREEFGPQDDSMTCLYSSESRKKAAGGRLFSISDIA